MRPPALLGVVPLALPRGRDEDGARSAPAIGQTRLTPSITLRASRGISWPRSALGRARGLSQSTLGSQSRDVHDVYAGLSNTSS